MGPTALTVTTRWQLPKPKSECSGGLCEGNSNTQVNAIVASIQKHVSKELKDKPWNIEGNDNGEWVLMDYINVVVHVFQKQKREYYDIESLWGDAKLTKVKSKD